LPQPRLGDDQPVVRICGVATIAGQAELRQLEIVAVTDADLPLDDHHQLPHPRLNAEGISAALAVTIVYGVVSIVD
jgi:hypothetical protein